MDRSGCRTSDRKSGIINQVTYPMCRLKVPIAETEVRVEKVFLGLNVKISDSIETEITGSLARK